MVFSTFEKDIINVWKRHCPTFDKSIIQYLTKILSNVWQEYYPTFDKNIIKVWKSVDKLNFPHLYIDIYACSEFHVGDRWQSSWSKRGRSVVENPVFQISTTVLKS